MAGIYVHIPFCRQACLYCNFHFSTSLKQKNDLIDALLKEVAVTTAFAGNETIATIYIGGGTPSLLETTELNSIFNAIYSKFSIASDAEITLEANPDDISPEKLGSSDWLAQKRSGQSIAKSARQSRSTLHGKQDG